jgi:hypothetical protein
MLRRITTMCPGASCPQAAPAAVAGSRGGQRFALQRAARDEVGGLVEQPPGLGVVDVPVRLQQPHRAPLPGRGGDRVAVELGHQQQAGVVVAAAGDLGVAGPVEQLPLDHPDTAFAHVFESTAHPRHHRAPRANRVQTLEHTVRATSISAPPDGPPAPW